MNDREYREQKQRIHRVMSWWVKHAGIGYWKVTSNYDRDGSTFRERDDIAHVVADWRYHEATIDWNMTAVAELDDEDLEYGVVHELMHVHLNEFWGARVRDEPEEGDREAKAHEESIATNLAKSMIWVRNRARVEGAKG